MRAIGIFRSNNRYLAIFIVFQPFNTKLKTNLTLDGGFWANNQVAMIGGDAHRP